jgi:hypothetical protein
MKDFVRIGVTDPAEEMRIGEGTFERVIVSAKGLVESGKVYLEHLETARVMLREGLVPLHNV